MKQNPIEPFLVFSLGRSGSTSIANFLNFSSPNICLFEPFNPDLYGGHYRSLLFNVNIDTSLREIAKTHSGFKHVCGASGWPFPENTDYNKRVLLSPDHKVLFLYRRNDLRRIISDEIAAQAGIWHPHGSQVKKWMAHKRFTDIDHTKIKRLLREDRNFISLVINILTTTPQKQSKVVEFTSIFGRSTAMAERISCARSILEFLHINRSNLSDSAIEKLLLCNPTNTPEFYINIPGLETIDSIFGCRETGFLFEDE